METEKVTPTHTPKRRHSKAFFAFILILGIMGGSHMGIARDDAATGADLKTTPLIPREVLFGNPDKAMARLSPDGKHLSYLAPVDGVLNVWVAPGDQPEKAEPVTQDKKRGIRMYSWSYTPGRLLYLQDSDGDENYHIYSVDVEKKETIDLTPIEGVKAQIEQVSHRSPSVILVGLNDRDPQLHDIYRIDILSGSKTLVEENPGFAGYLTDDDYHVRFAMKMTPEGGQSILKPDGKGDWEDFVEIGPKDVLTTYPMGFNKDGTVLYISDSRDRNTSAFEAIDLNTMKESLIAEDPRADLSDVMTHPTEMNPQAAAFTYDRKIWKVIDPAIKGDLEYLESVTDGDVEVVSRTLDDKQWMVAYVMDDGPIRYYRYDRGEKKAHFLFTNRNELEKQPLVKMNPVIVKSRDGLNLVNYLSLPKGSDSDGDGFPDQPLPMVLLVHGGPWARSEWGYDPEHQWLANRGYAVLDVNFRGSTGFGKDFANAGNMEWAGKMHDDLIDSVNWAVEKKIAIPEKIAISGGSYGGYATLVGLTFTPGVFACGIDIVGPSNLITLLESIPPYWAPMIEMFTTRVGDHRTEEGKKFLTERSPLSKVDQIEDPLLIGQGANDPRVKQAEADQIVNAMEEKKIPVTYVLYPDEGHGFARPENRISFFAVMEAFLAEYLGGRYEAIGEDFKGSSITVPEGKDGVPGLAAALAAHSNE
ncbi:MAG: S9 family peptidase [Candidatus Omnitrophica bacterium]|nr:S9 family peptidase [Candidatus Omnitrophota bacterium]